MRRTWALRAVVLLAVIGLTGTAATADNGPTQFATTLSGFNEVPPILTDGHGTFHATVHGDSLTYTLQFSGLTSAPLQAHIHFAQRGVNGGIFLFLCSNLGNGPAGTPACPADGTPVTRTVTAADFVAITTPTNPNPQNVPANDFAGAVRILRSGDAYANVHSANFPGGEIRGQIHFGDD
jgi:CHRD domain